MSTIIYIILTVLIFIYGYTIGKYQIFPYTLMKKIFRMKEKKVLNIKGYFDISNKIEVDCNSISREKNKTMVILAFGQANAANSAEIEYKTKYNVYNVFGGKCYKADDPLLGASATTNQKGSVWGRLGDKIIENGMYENVVIKSIGVAGSPINCWTVDGRGIGWGGIMQDNYHSRIIEANEELKLLDFAITHILFHQGEADTLSETTTIEYKERFLNMLNNMRKNNIIAPIYVSLASRYYNKTSREVIAAQKQLIQEYDDVLEGPNTDIIDGLDDRVSIGCHFSEIGIEKYANAWLNMLRN